MNTDDVPSLELVKQVNNDNGGTALITAWTLSAAGPTPISGAGGAASGPGQTASHCFVQCQELRDGCLHATFPEHVEERNQHELLRIDAPIEEYELLEQVNVLLILEQRAVKRRNRVARILSPERLHRNIFGEKQLDPVKQL